MLAREDKVCPTVVNRDVLVEIMVVASVVGISVTLKTNGISQVDRFPKLAVILNIIGKPELSAFSNTWLLLTASCENCSRGCA